MRNFRTKVDIKKWKWKRRNRSLEGAEYSIQVSAPHHSQPPFSLSPPPAYPPTTHPIPPGRYRQKGRGRKKVGEVESEWICQIKVLVPLLCSQGKEEEEMVVKELVVFDPLRRRIRQSTSFPCCCSEGIPALSCCELHPSEQ